MDKKEIRSIRGTVDLVDFALLLGVSPVTVWRWESGKVHPEGATVVLLELMRDQRRDITKLLWNRASKAFAAKSKSAQKR